MESVARASLTLKRAAPARTAVDRPAVAIAARAPAALPFVDTARLVAVVLMIPGHAVNALLAEPYRHGEIYHGWIYVTGLVSCTFLVAAGLVFAWRVEYAGPRLMAAMRQWRLVLVYVAIGYAMQLPTGRLSDMPNVTPHAWAAFFDVNILQAIGVSIAGLQALALCCRASRQLAVLSAVLFLTVTAATPLVAAVSWTDQMPAPLAAYLSGESGSLFPLFPWSAYVFLGASLGAWMRHEAPPTAGSPLASPASLLVAIAAVLLTAASWLTDTAWQYGAHDVWHTAPLLIATRAGLVTLVLAAAHHLATRWPPLRSRTVVRLARSSLFIYVVHVVSIYGSVWNTGLDARWHEALGPAAVAAIVVALGATTLPLAAAWTWLRHQHRITARVIRVAIAATLVATLLR